LDYILLGNSDLNVSRLGFGCCPMGKHEWGKVSTDELIESAVVALDKGVNFFDTSDIYGMGESERILGNVLRGRRSKVIVATKFGVRRDNRGNTFYDNSPAWIEEALESSLRRLGTHYVDLYQIHYRDTKTELSDVIEVLEKKRQEGKIRYYGLSNVSFRDTINYILPREMISFQIEYSLAKRIHENEILRIFKEKSLGFLSWGSLGQGVLSGKYTTDIKFDDDDRRRRPIYVNFHGEKFQKNLRIVKAMQKVKSNTGHTLPQIAVRWILDHLGFGVVLVGIKKPEQVLENIGAFGWHLAEDELRALDAVSAG
jgi:myo-inositol catabolism protein IolS